MARDYFAGTRFATFWSRPPFLNAGGGLTTFSNACSNDSGSLSVPSSRAVSRMRFARSASVRLVFLAGIKTFPAVFVLHLSSRLKACLLIQKVVSSNLLHSTIHLNKPCPQVGTPQSRIFQPPLLSPAPETRVALRGIQLSLSL